MSEQKENLGRAFGFRRMLDTTGAIIGPLIAMLILAMVLDGNSESAYRTIFTIALITAAIAVLILLFVKEETTQAQDGKKIFADILRAKGFKSFIFASLIFAVGEFTIAVFLLRAG